MGNEQRKLDLQYQMTEQGILIDLGTKANGFLQAVFPPTIEREIDFLYGPYHDFIKISGKLVCLDGAHFHNKLLSCRFILIKTQAEPLFISFFPEMRELELKSKFICNDLLLNNIFEVGAHTIRLCTVKHSYSKRLPWYTDQQNKFITEWKGYNDSEWVIMDGSRRDREVWMGDLMPEIMLSYYLYEDTEAIKNSFKIFFDQVEDDGNVVASSNSKQYFLEYNCVFLITLERFVTISGDLDFLIEHYEKAKIMMNFLISREGYDGLLTLCQKQTWAYTLSRQGRLTSSNCLFYGALKAMENIASMLSREHEAKVYGLKAKILRSKILKYGFDKEKDLFLDVLNQINDEMRYSLDANVYALLFDVCEDEVMSQLISSMEKNFYNQFGSKVIIPQELETKDNWLHNKHVWPFLVGLQAEAYMKAGYVKKGLDLILRCHGTMIKHGAQTFWEVMDGEAGSFVNCKLSDYDIPDVDIYNSACHGWSGYPSVLLIQYIAGLQSTGMENGTYNVVLRPELCGLSTVMARLWTPKGALSIEYKLKDKNLYIANIEVPEGVTLKFNGKGKMILKERVVTELNNGRYIYLCEEMR